MRPDDDVDVVWDGLLHLEDNETLMSSQGVVMATFGMSLHLNR